MLNQLIQILRQAKLELTPTELAEALLLARFLPKLTPVEKISKIFDTEKSTSDKKSVSSIQDKPTVDQGSKGSSKPLQFNDVTSTLSQSEVAKSASADQTLEDSLPNPNEFANGESQYGRAILPTAVNRNSGSASAIPFRSPRARALPSADKIAGALRPLVRRDKPVRSDWVKVPIL